jgi:uncharacterized membrane protein
MNKKLKRKLFGLLLVIFGSIIIVYSIFSSTGMGFLSIYIGTMMLVAGLNILGLNVSPYGIG